MSGGKLVKASGLKDRNPFTQWTQVRLEDVLLCTGQDLEEFFFFIFSLYWVWRQKLTPKRKVHGVTSQKTTILSHLCVNLRCHNLQFFIIRYTIMSSLLKSTKVLYHPETCRVSGKYLSCFPKQAHTQDGGSGGRGCRAAASTQIEILKT